MIKIFKRISDGRVLTYDKPSFASDTDEQLFTTLFGALEAFDVAQVDAWPPRVRTFDVVAGNFVFTQYTQEEIDALPQNARKRRREEDATDFSTHPFRDLTPQQAEDWINANVTDLASAKVALRRIVKVLIYLVRRSDLN